MRLLIILLCVTFLQACKHPLAIQGEGDIVELNGTGRGCSLEQFQAEDPACTDNGAINEDYFVNYRGIPRPGWRFVRWDGACAPNSVAPDCRLDMPANLVNFWDENWPGLPATTLTAIFEQSSGNEPFPLFTGASWTFAWTHLDQSASQDGSSSNTYFGEFTVTLGDPSVFQGYLAYPVTISGPQPENINIQWQYLALSGDGDLLGSFDGHSWVTIYQSSGSTWSAGGFLYRFGGTINPTLRTFESELNSYSALVLGAGSSSSFCEIIAGVEVCGDEAGSLTVNEYFKLGVGPAALYFRQNVSDSGGGFFTSFTDTINLELVATNLTAADGTTFNRSPYTSLQALDPADYLTTSGSSYIRGMLAFADRLWVFLSDREDEAVLVSYDSDTASWQQHVAPETLRANDRVLCTVLDGQFYAFINHAGGIEAWKVNDSGSWELESTISASVLSANNLPTSYRSVGVVPATLASSQVLFTTWSHDDEVLNYWPANPSGNPWSFWADSELDIPWSDGSNAEAFSLTAASNGANLYAVGGGRSLSEVTLNNIRRFSVDGTWTFLAPMSVGRLTPAVAAVDGKLYVFGGEQLRRTSSFINPWVRDELASAERYDPASDSWSPLPDMPAPQGGEPIATSDDESVYISRSSGRGEHVILKFTPEAANVPDAG